MKSIIALILTFLTSMHLQSEEISKETNVKIKKGGAVTEFSKDDGFKLSKEAINNLSVSFKALGGSGPWVIPKSAIVKIKHSVGVYRRWEGWITMVLVTVVDESKDTVTIKSVDLQEQDQVAVTGVPFLRMTEADLNSDTVDACSH